MQTNSRLGWTRQQEEFLKHLHQVQMVSSWKLISEKMNQKFCSFQRSAKQCRERYINYVEVGSLNDQQAWSQQSDKFLFQKYKELGSRWTQIRKFMPERSQNFLKNKFYGAMRRVHRKINKAEKQNKLVKQKPIKFDTILKVLQDCEAGGFQGPKRDEQANMEWIQQLKQTLIQMALFQKDKSNQEMLQLIKKIHKFNSVVRFFNITKQRKGKTVKRKNLPPLLKKETKMKIKESQVHIKTKVFNGQEILILTTNKLEREDKIRKYEISEDMQQLLENIELSFPKAKHKDLLEEVDIIMEGSFSSQNNKGQ